MPRRVRSGLLRRSTRRLLPCGASRADPSIRLILRVGRVVLISGGVGDRAEHHRVGEPFGDRRVAADVDLAGTKGGQEIPSAKPYLIHGRERLIRDVHGALYHPLAAAQQEMFTGRHVLQGATEGSALARSRV